MALVTFSSKDHLPLTLPNNIIYVDHHRIAGDVSGLASKKLVRAGYAACGSIVSKRRNNMKKVVLLGDSIRLIGYGNYVAEALKDEFTVWQPEDNCRFASYTLRMLFDYRPQIEDADIIHWNNGAWDLCRLYEDGDTFTPIEVYCDTLRRIASILLKITDKVIFATTTPVRDVNVYNDNETVRAFNEAAIKTLAPMGVKINDLYGVVAPDIDGMILDDNIHLNDKAARLCAEKAVQAIRESSGGEV